MFHTPATLAAPARLRRAAHARELLKRVREFIRQSYAWPGGYSLALLMDDGETLCNGCARAEYRQVSNSTRHALRDGWTAADVFVHWEGAPLICAHCNGATPSAYGDPDAPEQCEHGAAS